MRRCVASGSKFDRHCGLPATLIFADLGIRDATAEPVKAQLTFQVAKRRKALGLVQTAAAARLGVSQRAS
jgi:hypothetical protein